jgi:hypothetical protein
VVQYADRRVEYRAVEEMLTALQAIEAELGAATSPPRPRQWLGYSAGKGI